MNIEDAVYCYYDEVFVVINNKIIGIYDGDSEDYGMGCELELVLYDDNSEQVKYLMDNVKYWVKLN